MHSLQSSWASSGLLDHLMALYGQDLSHDCLAQKVGIKAKQFEFTCKSYVLTTRVTPASATRGQSVLVIFVFLRAQFQPEPTGDTLLVRPTESRSKHRQLLQTERDRP